MSATVEVFGLHLKAPGAALLYFPLHFVAVAAGLALQVNPPSVALYWPAAGTLLAALLLYPYRYWPLLVLAALAAEIAANAAFAPQIELAHAAILSVVSAIEGLLGAAAVRWLLAERLNFARVRTVLIFGAAVTATSFAGAMLAAAIMQMAEFSAGFWQDQQTWWIGDLLGDLTLAPLLLTFGYFGLRPHRDRDLATDLRSVVAAAVLLAVLLVVFVRERGIADSPLDTPYLLYPALIWLAMVSGARRTAAGILAIIVISSAATLQGLGPFARAAGAPDGATYELQTFLALVVLPALVLQAVMFERRAATLAAQRSDERYRAFVANSSEAIFRTELTQPMPISLPVDEQIDWLKRNMFVAECNPAFLASQGLSTSSPNVGSKPGEHPTWSKLYTDRIREAIADNYRIKDIEHVVPGPYGLDRVMLISMVGIVDDGHLRRIWGTGRDITRIRQQEQTLAEHDLRLRALATEITLAEERARRKLAADLHDGPAQNLIGIAMELGVLKRSQTRPVDAEKVEEIERIVADTNQQIRSLMAELTPPGLYDGGLVAGIRWLAERMSKKQRLFVAVEDDGAPKPLDEHATVLLFQTVRELLQNVAKHARARQATVRCWTEGDLMLLEVVDPGIGFDARSLDGLPRRDGGFGLFSIRERLALMRGTLRVQSVGGQGTTVRVSVPMRQQRGLFDEALSA
jgi:signal transduction histidine kinase